MTNVYYTNRTTLKAASPASGDVAYLTELGEVYDITNSKTKVTNTGAIKTAAGTWAILNTEKTRGYSLTRPPVFEAAQEYAKGAIVNKDGAVYMANDKVPANTTFTTGTSGATFTKISGGGGGGVTTRSNSPSGTVNASGKRFWTDQNCRIDKAGSLIKVNFASWVDPCYLCVMRPDASAVADSFKVGATWSIKKAWLVPNGATTFSTGGYQVAVGDYLGIYSFGGSGTKVLINNGGASDFSFYSAEYSSAGQSTFSVGYLLTRAMANFGWEQE